MIFLKSITTFFFVSFCIPFNVLNAQQTERVYLSGKGIDDAIEWDFFCTAGRKSGEWAKIPVPSCWEQHGFGIYNYGHDADAVRGKEKGVYKSDFIAEPRWKHKNIRIVFEGSMTDTEVRINGRSAGEKHQGGFYRFSYDISKLVKLNSENHLEVTVSKHSEDTSVNDAERYADYWIFGGIFRPVYLEIKPEQYIDRMAIDAKADGSFRADVYLTNIRSADGISARILDENKNQVGDIFHAEIQKKSNQIRIETILDDIKTWTPEFPKLYFVEVDLLVKDEVIHSMTERFGFRTVEIKERDGIYVNGVKIKFKGVCRHSFWPESGRALSKTLSIQDVQLIKDMNMNAVRMSHYPPDPHFLDVCDSLGLFVLDELAGWQAAYDTEIGRKLVREMVLRDVNHPSIVIWDNGNEGGWNTDLDDEFKKYDPQGRTVIHPYEKFRKTDTNHYIDYNYGTNDSFNGNHIFFPTEFLHGLFDGGNGAGLGDFWDLMWNKPTSAGGFLWVFSDESIKRTDKDGILDSDGNHAPDGILGPYREKEGSFYTIKEIWSPIYFEEKYITAEFDGIFKIQNRYHFTNLKQCRFSYELVRFPDAGSPDIGYTILNTGRIISTDLSPGDWGYLKVNLPDTWKEADALYIKAIDPYDREIFIWDWPIHDPRDHFSHVQGMENTKSVNGLEQDDLIVMSAGDVRVIIEKESGILHEVTIADKRLSLSGGPVLAEGTGEFIDYKTVREGSDFIYQASFKGNLKSVSWTMLGCGLLKLNVIYVPNNHIPYFGINFNYPENLVMGIRWLGDGPYRVWKNRLKGVKLNVWEKEYNCTVTGESYNYPEFKGYHSNMYWLKLMNKERDFNIYTTTEDLFFRMYTPDDPVAAPEFTKVDFPGGDISFLQGINAIGTKFKKPELLGPQSQLNMYNRHPTDSDLQIELYFDFR